MNRGDTEAIEHRGRFRFAFEALHFFLASERVGRQEFQCHEAFELRVLSLE